MRAILTMTRNDLRIFFSQPGNWVGLTLLPILFTVGLGFAFSGDSGPQLLRVEVIDHDRSAASGQLLDALAAASDTLALCLLTDIKPDTEPDSGTVPRCEQVETTLEAAQERVREGASDALIVLPAGYADAVAIGSPENALAPVNNTPVEITFYSLTPTTSPDAVLQTFESVLQRLNSAGLTAAVADAVLRRIGEQSDLAAVIEPWRAAFVAEVFEQSATLLVERPAEVRFTGVGGAADEAANETNTSVQGFTQSVPGVGSMFVMFTVFGGMALIQRERQRGTLQRLAVFPLMRGQIVAGKILTYFTLGMLQYLLVFAVGLVVGLDFGPTPWMVLPVMAAFVLCCTAFTFAVAPALQSESQAGAVTQLASLAFASLGGAWWPLEIVPDFMQIVGHLSPVAWAMDAFRDLLFYGGGLLEIAPEVAALLGAAALLFALGIGRFRYL